MNHLNPNYKIALYVRNSDPKQDTPEGTIKNQEERLRNYIALKNATCKFGEIIEVYIDRSLSAKNMNRPAVQKMLYDIQKGKINMIAVSELSRITRNMKDFGEVWELLQSCKCGFLSLRENVDTSGAAGEMVMFMLANIAQFERKQTSERVSASYKVRASRGLYGGGTISLGYKRIKDKPGYLAVDDEKAETVKTAFDYFLKYEILSKTAKKLNEDGVKIHRLMQGGGHGARLDFFTVDNLHKILINKAYIGVRVYRDEGKKHEAKAVWNPIIEEDKFYKVNKMLKANRSKRKGFTARRYPYILSSLTYCIACKDVMCGKSAHGKRKKYGYYEHSWAGKKGSTFVKKSFKCEPHRIPATKIEEAVLENIKELIESPKLTEWIVKKAKEIHFQKRDYKKVRNLQSKISGYNGHLEALTQRLGELPKSVSASLIYQQMEKLELVKKEAKERLRQLEEAKEFLGDVPIDFESYKKTLQSIQKSFKNKLEPEEKAKIIKRLVHKIEIGTESIKIHYYAGRDALGVLEPPKNNPKKMCSSSLTNGEVGRTRTCDQQLRRLLLYPAELRPRFV